MAGENERNHKNHSPKGRDRSGGSLIRRTRRGIRISHGRQTITPEGGRLRLHHLGGYDRRTLPDHPH